MKEEKNNNEEIKKGIRAILRHLIPFRTRLAWLFILGIVSAIANGFVPYVTGRFFDALILVSEHKNIIYSGLPKWLIFLGLWVLIQLIANNVDWIGDRKRRKVDTDMHFKIQSDGFEHMFKLPLTYHKDAHMNGQLQKISQAAWRVSAIVRTIINIAPQFLSLIIGIALAATINMTLAGILVLGVLIYMFLLLRILKPAAEIDSAAHHAWMESWDDAASAVNQIESVKQSATEKYEIEKMHKSLLGNASRLWNKVEMTWSNVNFFQRITVFITQLTIFTLSVNLVSNGSISIGQLIALNGYAGMFFGPFVSLGNNWQTIQNGIISAAHTEEIFNQKEEVYNPKDSVSVGKIFGSITFKNVSFGYGEDRPEILSNINLEIKPGEVVAFVGESGVGKSTAISLISGYYFPSKGEVLVDGIATKKWNLSELRSRIGVVPQEVALFNDSIKTNIRYGSFDATDEKVIQASKDSHLEEFINNLPNKYETLVGERGVKLSVGQKQRMAIARAILRDPAILILDEPTSALDANTEKIVTEGLERLMKDRTTLIIAHRLSTVRKANKILVFQKGKIVEAGQHDELLRIENGAYRKLYEYQIGLH